MKTNRHLPVAFLSRALAGLLASALAVTAAPLAETTAVHTRPDPAAPAITFLKAGTQPTAAMGAMAGTPAGWMAIELPGPFEGYVENKDLTKSLDVRPGAPIRVAPRPDAGILTVGEKSDKTTITGLHGRWTQINLERPMTGYIRIGGTPDYTPPIATTPAAAAPAPGGPAMAPAPFSPGAFGTAEAGRAAPMVNLGDGGSAALPRQFAGRFVSTRRPFTPRRPYDYALVDDAGRRYAYLDMSKLLLTEQLDKYVDRAVVVFGMAKPFIGGGDLVLEVESLQLK